MLRTGQFYQLWLMFVLAASAGLMIICKVALIAKDQAHIGQMGYSPVAILAIFNTADGWSAVSSPTGLAGPIP